MASRGGGDEGLVLDERIRKQPTSVLNGFDIDPDDGAGAGGSEGGRKGASGPSSAARAYAPDGGLYVCLSVC